jgi:3-hydroxybutyryl-CoA dehydratase
MCVHMYAESTVFSSLITHGGIQSGALNALVAVDPGSVFMQQNLKYTAPVRVGDTVTASRTVPKVHKTNCTIYIHTCTTWILYYRHDMWSTNTRSTKRNDCCHDR